MISLILLIFASFAKVFMDTISDGIYSSPWWNKSLSWSWKWKNTTDPVIKSPWYYLGIYKPLHIEKFPFSSTILVWATDGWHFFQMIFLTLVFSAIVLFKPITGTGTIHMISDFLILNIAFLVPFEILFEHLSKKK